MVSQPLPGVLSASTGGVLFAEPLRRPHNRSFVPARDYWVVGLNGRRLLAYRDPRGGDYAAAQALGPADAVAPLAAPAATVRVADLLL